MIFKPGDRVVTPMGRIGIVKRELKAHGDIEFQYEDDPSIEGRATLKPQYLKHYRDPEFSDKPVERKDLEMTAGRLLGRMGGKKGGPARAKALSAERRHEIAQLGGIHRQHGKKLERSS